MQVTASTKTVKLTADLPSGWRDYGPVVPELRYPVELATFANYAVPKTGPLGDTVPARPRADLMPADSAIIWLTLGDRTADQRESEPFADITVTGGTWQINEDLDEAREQRKGLWNNTDEYARIIGLGADLYCTVSAYVGKRAQPTMADIQRILTSLRFAY